MVYTVGVAHLESNKHGKRAVGAPHLGSASGSVEPRAEAEYNK